MILIKNFTKNKLNQKHLNKIAEKTLEVVEFKKPVEISLVIIGEKRIRSLNKKYRKINEITDVLSFGSECEWFGVTCVDDRVTGLELPANQLSGSLPSVLRDLSSLKVLDLEHNRITGQIPVELGDLAQLQVLNLRNNQLTGAIPGELGKLIELQVLNLRSNQLQGSIPALFAAIMAYFNPSSR